MYYYPSVDIMHVLYDYADSFEDRSTGVSRCGLAHRSLDGDRCRFRLRGRYCLCQESR